MHLAHTQVFCKAIPLTNLSLKVAVLFDFTHCICLLLDFSLTVKAATLIFISGRGSAISSAKEGKSWLYL